MLSCRICVRCVRICVISIRDVEIGYNYIRYVKIGCNYIRHVKICYIYIRYIVYIRYMLSTSCLSMSLDLQGLRLLVSYPLTSKYYCLEAISACDLRHRY